MKNRINKKKIILSVVSVTLVLATLLSLFPFAAGGTQRSLEYIELLKQKYEGSTMKILEIAPSEDDAVFGYYVGGSEPIAKWQEKAGALKNRDMRERYVNNLFADLTAKKLMEADVHGDTTPMYYQPYKEYYPWEVDNLKDYSSLLLENQEQVSVRGFLEEVGEGEGDYSSAVKYVPSENTFKNYFEYFEWQQNLGKTIKEKHNAEYNAKKYQNTKILVPDNSARSIGVFGSTETNWNYFDSLNPAAVYYDLSEVYAQNEYYTISVDEKGGTFSLSFDVKSVGGKGIIQVIPVKENGAVVGFPKNFSKQFWYVNEAVDSGHYEFSFNVPSDTEIAALQVKFDVNNLEANAVFSNINIKKYNKELFDFNSWRFNNDGRVIIDSGKRCIEIKNHEGQKDKELDFWLPDNIGHSNQFQYSDCDSGSLYTLTYHVENEVGATSVLNVFGYDATGNRIDQPLLKDVRVSSGTYTVTFGTRNAYRLLIAPNNKLNESANFSKGGTSSFYSNIALCRVGAYVLENGEATHIQDIDHFESGAIEYDYDLTSVFDYREWHNSDSNSKSEDSSPNSEITSHELNGVITIRGKASTKISPRNTVSENIYYIPVQEGETYRLSYIANSDKKAPFKLSILYSNNAKNQVMLDEETINPKDVGAYEYTKEFTVGKDIKWIQIGFGNTDENQRVIYSDIKLQEKTKPAIFYYSVKFNKIPGVETIQSDEIPIGTPIYTKKFEVAGTAGSFVPVPNETYYYYYEDGDEYVAIDDFANVAQGTKIYKFGGIYDYVGKKGDKGLTFNIKYEFFTAEINYDDYKLLVDTSQMKYGSLFYTKTSEGYVEHIVDENTIFDPAQDYYIKSTVVSETFDMAHPYWAVGTELGFLPADEDEHPLFKAVSDGYTFVGEGNGNYLFTADKEKGDITAVINVGEVYYEGGSGNNEWFKKYVLDMQEESLGSVGVKVSVVTPEYLNQLSEEALKLYVQGYELIVFSYGGADGNAHYKTDITKQVKDVLKMQIEDEWESLSEKDFDYMIPVMVDNRICKMNKSTEDSETPFPNFNSLALELTKEVVGEGGVKGYVYKFNTEDISSEFRSIVNDKFKAEIKPRNYVNENSPYYDAYKEIEFENEIRTNNNSKYALLSNKLSEANLIRFILNFRGQRVIIKKDTIRILEIQPYTDKSSIAEINPITKETIRLYDSTLRWFGDEVPMYETASGEYNPVNFTVTTVSSGELAAKDESLVEKYDLIYIGASMDNFEKITEADTVTKVDEDGQTVPNFASEEIAGNYYISNGERVVTVSSTRKLLSRAHLAGMLGRDYFALRDLPLLRKLFELGEKKILFFSINFEKLDKWFVDSSDATFRKSGNDLTTTMRYQLIEFSDSGRPIIYADELVEHDYSGSFSAILESEIDHWTAEDDHWLPVIKLTATLVCEDNTLPPGVEPYFTWHFAPNADSGSSNGTYKNDGGFDTWDESNSSVYRIDTNDDGVPDKGVCEFIFHDGKYSREFGTYWVDVTFKFKQKKYKGLSDNFYVRSNAVQIGKDDVMYTLTLDKDDCKTGYKGLRAKATISLAPNDSKHPNNESKYLPSTEFLGGREYSNNISIRWSALKLGKINYSTEYNDTATYEVFSGLNGTGVKVSDDYTRPTARGKSIVTNATFKDVPSKERLPHNKVVGYKLEMSVDNEIGNTLVAWTYMATGDIFESQKRGPTHVTYFIFKSFKASDYEKNVEGIVPVRKDRSDFNFGQISSEFGKIKTAESGIKLNEKRVDTSSKFYDMAIATFANSNNVFSVSMLVANEKASENSNRLLSRANISSPMIEVLEHPEEYPTPLNNRNFELKFKFNNFNDETFATSSYECNFYVDLNADGKYSLDEIQEIKLTGPNVNGTKGLKASTKEQDNVYKIIKVFPKEVVGIVPWKVEVGKEGYLQKQKLPHDDEEYDAPLATAHYSVNGYAYIVPTEVKEVSCLQILASDYKPNYIDNTEYKQFLSAVNASDYKDGFIEGVKDDLQGEVYELADVGRFGFPDKFFGCALLADVFVSEELTDPDLGGGAQLTRYIIYDDGTENGRRSGKNEFVDRNADIKGLELIISDRNQNESDVFKFNITFTNFRTLNDMKDIEKIYDYLQTFDILLWGFSDSYAKHYQQADVLFSFLHSYYGINQPVSRAVEKCIDDGQSMIFTHDAFSGSNNFVNYIANDVMNSINSAGQNVINWFRTNWEIFKAWITGKDPKDPELYTSDLVTSRVKQGYYANVILRAKVGQDRFGVTEALKQRVIRYYERKGQKPFATYSDIEYSDLNLRFAYDYASMYSFGNKSTSSALKVNEMPETKGIIEEYEGKGYDISYKPNTHRQEVDVFFHGYTDFTIERYSKRVGKDQYYLTNQLDRTNNGQITHYPYILDEETDEKGVSTGIPRTTPLDINPTHEQYYQVPLQKDELGQGVTVWYCMSQGDVDNLKEKSQVVVDSRQTFNTYRNNAVNAYYLYTYKNITYTGMGHSNDFSVDEAKLFINVLVGAYRNFKTKPGFVYTDEAGEPITHQAVASSADEDKNISIEDDNIYFKVKDTTLSSEVKKDLAVRFYMKEEKIVDPATGKVTYKYSEPVKDINFTSGQSGVTVNNASASKHTEKGIELEAGGSEINGLSENVTYSITVPQELKDKLKTQMSPANASTPAGTELYSKVYDYIGTANSVEAVAGEKYYYIDETGRFKEAAILGDLDPETQIYKFNGIYHYEGKKGEFTENPNTQYYAGNMNENEEVEIYGVVVAKYTSTLNGKVRKAASDGTSLTVRKLLLRTLF